MPIDEDAFADVIIIGAGVIGCALAFELSRRGRRTLNLDRAPAAGTGSTSNSCAIVRFSYSTVVGVNMAWEGVHYWKDWAGHVGDADELGCAEYRQVGQVMLTTAADDHASRVVKLWQELDIPHEVLSLDALEDHFPYLDHGLYGPPTRPDDPAFWKEATGTITGAIFCPDAGYVSDPHLACHNLQRAAESAGGRFGFRSDVVAIDRQHGRVSGVTLADGRRFAAPTVVNVAGPHSAIINKMAGVYDAMNIKTAALRHEVHHVSAPVGVDFMTRGVVGADDDVGFYFRPEVGNNLLIGSVDPKCDALEFVDPDDYDPTVTDAQWEAQVLRANRRMPDLGVPHERKGVVGLYDASDDWMPIYDRTDLDGFFVAIGTSGNQFKNTGSAAAVMADLIEAVDAGHDHDADPLQVTGCYTGRSIDVGAYSRNRSINPESSLSVHG